MPRSNRPNPVAASTASRTTFSRSWFRPPAAVGLDGPEGLRMPHEPLELVQKLSRVGMSISFVSRKRKLDAISSISRLSSA
jgi:hypothetical protein